MGNKAYGSGHAKGKIEGHKKGLDQGRKEGGIVAGIVAVLGVASTIAALFSNKK